MPINLIEKFLKNIKVNIIILIIFFAGVTSYVFKSQIGSFIFEVKYKSPVEWNNMQIYFPEGMIYEIDSKGIQFFYWEDPKGFLYFRKINLNKITKEYLLEFFEG